MNICFEVSLNGKKLTTAGMDSPAQVLITSLSFVKQFPPDKAVNLSLHVSGLHELHQEHYEWLQEPLRIHDEVVIRVMDSGTPDSPVRTIQRAEDRNAVLKRKLAYYYRLKEELKEVLEGAEQV